MNPAAALVVNFNQAKDFAIKLKRAFRIFYCECAYTLVDREGLTLLAGRLARLRPPRTIDYEQTNLVAPNATPLRRLLRPQFGRNRESNGGDIKKPATKILLLAIASNEGKIAANFDSARRAE